MTALDIASARRALHPVRNALQLSARDDASHVIAEAERDATRIAADARARAREILDAARVAGEADAAASANAERSRTRRALRGDELAAQRAAEERLRHDVIRAVRLLRTDADYPVLRDRLREKAFALLGADAVITEDQAGGIVAVNGGRRLDLRLEVFATRALEHFGPRLDGLWK